MISTAKQLCCVIGDPIEHSLSPLLHNAAYAQLGLADQYSYVAFKVCAANLSQALQALQVLNFRGISCTMPHKMAVLRYLDHLDCSVKEIGAANTIVFEAGKLCGYNTDWQAVFECLKNQRDWGGKRAAVIGSGGMGQAVIYAMQKLGMEAIVFDRIGAQAQQVQRGLGFKVQPLEELGAVIDCDVIFNATPIGMYPESQVSLVSPQWLKPSQVVCDAVYRPRETLLLKQARERGATVISGLGIFVRQAALQCELFTGRRPSIDGALRILMAQSEIKFCLPVGKTSKLASLASIKGHEHRYSVFEVWLGAIQDIDSSFPLQLMQTVKKEFIFVLRPCLGVTLEPQDRDNILRALSATAAYVDCDVLLEKDTIQYIRANNLALNLILSYHNFENTPDDQQLREIVAAMQEIGGKVFKLACLCRTPSDALRLLQFGLDLKSQGKRVVALGMGEQGVISRIFAGLWGDEWVYAPYFREEANAPGQLTFDQLSAIYAVLPECGGEQCFKLEGKVHAG